MQSTFTIVLLHRLRDSDPARFAALSVGLLDLLNQQWPRSAGSRSQSLAALGDQLPVFLLLVDGDSDAQRPIAACKLSRIGSASLPAALCDDVRVPTDLDACLLLENVIVDRAKRRSGLGRRLMDAMERFAVEYVRRSGSVTKASHRCAEQALAPCVW